MSHVNLGNVLYEEWRVRASARAALRNSLALRRIMRRRTRGSRMFWRNWGRRGRGRAPPERFRASRGAGTTVSRRGASGIAAAADFSGGRQHSPAHFLDDGVFETTVVCPSSMIKQPLPPHHLIFNSIGDADLAGQALAAAQSLAALSAGRRAEFSQSGDGDRTGRQCAAACGLAGVITPSMVTLSRELLRLARGVDALARHGLTFPLLLRTPGFHTGRHFVDVEHAGTLAEAWRVCLAPSSPPFNISIPREPTAKCASTAS